MAFGGRAWHANHPVLRQACTMRSFPTRSKTHIHNFQTYKLISTHTSLLWSLERGLGIGLQAMQEKMALISR